MNSSGKSVKKNLCSLWFALNVNSRAARSLQLDSERKYSSPFGHGNPKSDRRILSVQRLYKNNSKLHNNHSQIRKELSHEDSHCMTMATLNRMFTSKIEFLSSNNESSRGICRPDITELSLHVTLSKQSHSLRVYVDSALNNRSEERFMGSGARGKYKQHNKTDDKKVKAGKEHIEPFPKIEGHYTRRGSSREFLSLGLI